MLSLPELVRIYVCTQPTDMRKGFDSLAAVIRDWLRHDPLSGHLFVFRSRRGDRVKLLWWDVSFRQACKIFGGGPAVTPGS